MPSEAIGGPRPSARAGSTLLRASLLQRDEPAPHGVAHQFGLVLEAEFPHHVGAVVLDRSLADVEPGGDLRAGLPLGGELEYLALRGRQRLVRVELGGPGLFDVSVDGASR